MRSREALLILGALAVLFVAACGAGTTGIAPPPPPACPSPPTVGCVSGTVGVSVAAVQAAPTSPPVQFVKGARTPPPGAPQFVPDQLLVKFRSVATPTQAADLHRQLGTQELRWLERAGISVLQITTGETVQSVVSKYRAQPSVEYAEPNFYRYLAGGPGPQAMPNDEFYVAGFHWHYSNINLPAAWDVTTGSALVVVAVIDTGFLFTHEDLGNTTVAGFDFFSNDADPSDPGCLDASDLSHGTHVAGTVAAATNNAIGVAGVNWGGPGKTKIMPLRIFGNIGGMCSTTTARIVDAIRHAADHSARVINMSFGGSGFSQSEQDAVTHAFNTGVILIAAAGNRNELCDAFYPAAYLNVVGVSATGPSNAKAPYSNFGSCVDLAAPGGDIGPPPGIGGNGVLSTSGTPSDPSRYFFFEGTSMASPHVAGLAALLISKGVTGPTAVQNVMQNTATDLGTPLYDTTFGWGKINAGAALGASGPNPVKAFSGDLSGNTITVTSDRVTVQSNGVYQVTNAQPGTHSVFGWQDTNGNCLIDGGDLYGTVAGVTINAGATTGGVNISIAERSVGSATITPTPCP